MIKYKYIKNINNSKTIILLHGWGVNSSYMESLKNILKISYSIIIFDLPGHGENILDRAYKIDDYLDDIFFIICQEKITSLYGIGHSFGGKLLTYYALKYPLEGMILISPSSVRRRFSLIKFLKIKIYKILKKFKIKIPKIFLGSDDYKKAQGLNKLTFLNVYNQYLNKSSLNKISTPSYIIGFLKDKELRKYQLVYLSKHLKNSKLFFYEGDHFGYFSYLKEIKILLDKLTLYYDI